MTDNINHNKQERDKVLIDSRKKLLAEKRAHAIVEKLLENDITEDFFLKSVYYLSVEKYTDVVEERSISKQCGYAVCQNKLENIPRQQFKISRNVVYDITERKKFCSNICYKRSKFIEDQIPTYPLWLRETDGKTRISALQSGTGLQGEKVDLLNFVTPDESKDEPEMDEQDYTDINAACSVEHYEEKFIKHANPKCQARSRQTNQVDLDEVVGLFGEWVTVKSLMNLDLLPKDGDVEDTVGDDERRKAAKMKLLEERMNKIVVGKDDNKEKAEPSFEEINQYTYKVENYFQGQYTPFEEAAVKEKPAKKEEKETSDFTQSTVPNVDSKNQIVIRRQILLKKISSALNNIAPVLHNPSIVQDIRGLIGTFNLTSTNLVLKSNQLSVIVVMVLDLLQRAEHHSNFTVPESVGEFLKTVNIKITDIQSAVAHVIEKLISKPLCSSPVS